ncbi:MAG: hypothetical protein MjAS7_2000 [Metallosphaera javensis (ex Sakai et al. 2022)]|nr:MAG: hypothetical protein MjAS7_2000 [Metallosphaera javensis (ex Sakai et al. 2022)]
MGNLRKVSNPQRISTNNFDRISVATALCLRFQTLKGSLQTLFSLKGRD